MKILLGSLLLFFIGLGNAGGDSMSVNIDPNQTQFTITLPANPTTGYQWTVKKYDKSFLQLVASHYISPQTNLMGAGGQMQFKFELVEGETYPKNTTMQFKYARPWEPENGTLKNVTVNFQKD